MRGDTLNNTVKTLKEKYDNQEREENYLWSQLLKRKRLEQNRTLEEVSKGICSPSYLSKIENGQVDADAIYYKALFEKLDLKYEKVRQNRPIEIMPYLIKLYLLEQRDEVKAKIHEIATAKYYSESEMEQILLFNSLISDSLDEAKYYLTSLEVVRNTLTKEELWFITYCNALYLYKKNNFLEASEICKVLTGLTDVKEEYKVALYSLILEISFITLDIGKFFHYYELLNQLKLKNQLYTISLIHQMERIVLIAPSNYDYALKEMKRITECLKDNEVLVECYHLCLGIIYYCKGEYRLAYKTADVKNPSTRLTALMAAVVIKTKNFKECVSFEGIVKEKDYKNCTNPYYCFIEAAKFILEQYTADEMYYYYKNTLIPILHTMGLNYLKKLAIEEFTQLAIFLGRYKDSMKYLIECKPKKRLLQLIKNI